MKNFFLALCIVIFFWACQEDDGSGRYPLNTIIDCTEAAPTDSLEITEQLVGSWFWTESFCPCCPNSQPTSADKLVTVSFQSDQTLVLKEEGETIFTGEWTIILSQFGYLISIEDPPFYIDGYKTICDNQLLFDKSPVDGCMYLFYKEK